jgi:prophage maintenance system killer protein
MKNTKDILLYETEDGKLSFEVNLNKETVWLNQKEMAELFGKDSDTIGTHLKNIYKSKELEEKLTTAKYAVVRQEGKRKVTRQIKYYNLDAIISVGYRVNSKIGTQFRIWATNILKEYLIQGYAINEKQLKAQNVKLIELQNTIEILKRTVETQRIGLDEATGLLKVISDYSYALDLLDAYDHQSVEIISFHKREAYILTYEEAMRVIESMKTEFATDLFGNEKDDSFRGSLGAIYQTAFGEEVYPSIEEKGAHLLYFVVKNHSFSDGNKRIAAAIFIYFMEANRILYREDGSKRIADNTLVAITLMIAESKPSEKETIVKVLVNLINENN